MKSLLSIDTNAKTIKGQQFGFLTGILYLAPSDIAGPDICPMATLAGCKQACLYSAGRGVFNNVQQARINKTKAFHVNRQAFMETLVSDIQKLVRKAEKMKLIPLVRLNGTSDIKWELVFFQHNGKMRNIMEVFPNVQFYDYTKMAKRETVPGFPANYDLTFSYSGKPEFQKYNQQAIDSGMRIAVVFNDKNLIPSTFAGLPVISGDNSDIRHVDPKATVIALYAKGKAKTDNTGFVVNNSVIPVQLVA